MNEQPPGIPREPERKRNKEMTKDPYEVLGLSKGASEDEIKQAYRAKIKECHPDLHPDDPDANQKMSDVNTAYDMLMNPQKYNTAYGSQGYGSTSTTGTGYGSYGYGPGYNTTTRTYTYSSVEEMFEDLFGAMYGTGGFYTNYGGTTASRTAYAGNGQTDSTPKAESVDSDDVKNAVNSINGRQFRDALTHLSHVETAKRDARWNYLAGLSYAGLGYYDKAIPKMQTAAQMEPSNDNYYNLLQSYRRKYSYANTYTRTGTSYSNRTNAFGCSSPMIKFFVAIILLNLLLSIIFRSCGYPGYMFFI